jgi:hypothetical protein
MCRPAVLHRDEFGYVGTVERPGIDDLRAVCVDNLDTLARRKRAALPRRAGMMSVIRNLLLFSFCTALSGC